MVCLFDPLDFGTGNEVRVRVIGRTPSVATVGNPTAAEPWAFEVSTGGVCIAAFPAHGQTSARHPTLVYSCGGGRGARFFPGGRVDRKRSGWTIKATHSFARMEKGPYPFTARIIAAWFGGNSA